MARKNRIERQLEAALDDATKPGLSVSEQKLIQTRITTLAALVQREHDATVERLTAEVAALRTELDRVAASKDSKPIESLKEIKALVEKNRGANRT